MTDIYLMTALRICTKLGKRELCGPTTMVVPEMMWLKHRSPSGRGSVRVRYNPKSGDSTTNSQNEFRDESL